MPAGIAEHVVKDLARAVHDRRLLVEVRGRRHVTGHRQDPVDPVEGAESDFEHSQRIEGADLGCDPSLFDSDRRAESAHAGELPGDPRELARRPGCSVVDDDRIQRVVRRVRSVELEPEGFQPFSDTCLPRTRIVG